MICAACCGENRRTVFSCPEDCVYLHSGDAYRAQRSTSEVRERFQARYAGYLHAGRKDLANDLFLLEGLVFRLAAAAGKADDADVLEALSFVRRSFSSLATVEQFPSPLGREILSEMKKATPDESPLRRDQLQEATDELIGFLKSVSGCGRGERHYVDLLRVAAEPMGFGRGPGADRQRPSGIILPGED
jgi:hypothetical protein